MPRHDASGLTYAASLIVLLSPVVGSATNYTLVDIGALVGGVNSQATAVSNGGYVVGNWLTPEGETRAFRWHPTHGLTTFGAPAVTDGLPRNQVITVANGVNDFGHVVGNTTADPTHPDNPVFHQQAYVLGNDSSLSSYGPNKYPIPVGLHLLRDGVESDVMRLGSDARDINNNNIIVGGVPRPGVTFTEYAPSEILAGISSDNVTLSLRDEVGRSVLEDGSALWSTTSGAASIAGRAVGHPLNLFNDFEDFPSRIHGVRVDSFSEEINSHYRHVTGGGSPTYRSLFGDEEDFRAGNNLDFRTPLGINNHGQTVGTVFPGGSAAIFDPDTNMTTRLSTVTHNLGDTQLFLATDINDRGWVIGNAMDSEQAERAFLLIPDDQPNVLKNGGFDIAFESSFRINTEHRGWHITNPFAVGGEDLNGDGSEFAARFVPGGVEDFGQLVPDALAPRADAVVSNEPIAYAEQFVDFAATATTLSFDLRFDGAPTGQPATAHLFRVQLEHPEVGSQTLATIAESAGPFATHSLSIPTEFLGRSDVKLRFEAENDNAYNFTWDQPSGVLLNNVELIAQLPGDYDGNGFVDADDFQLWRSTYGSTGDLRADGNGDMVVDAADYSVWRDNLGAGTPLAQQSLSEAAVPEPGTTALLALGIVAFTIKQPQLELRAV